MRVLSIALILAVLSIPALAAEISGNYIEARSAGVYIGACFANSEVGLAGQEAVMGWKVTDGGWLGTRLNGLSVIGVVRANSTLGDPHHTATLAKSLLIVDQRATPEQARALAAFARFQLPEFLAGAPVERAPIEFVLGDHHGEARLVAGNMANITTRALHDSDSPCAAAEIYYPPLTPSQAHPALAITNEFSGPGLGEVWSIQNRPSAFLGTFSR